MPFYCPNIEPSSVASYVSMGTDTNTRRLGKSANPADPGPDKIRPYLMKNKMTARIVRF